MKKITLAVFVSVSSLFSPLALAKETQESKEKSKIEWALESDHSFKLNVGFGVSSQTETVTVGAESPSFLSASNKYMKNRHGIYIDFSQIRSKNRIFHKTSGQLADAFSHSFSFGLVTRTFFTGDEKFALFGKLGGNRYFFDKELTEKTLHWGYHLEVGAEHFYTHDFGWISSKEVKSSFFASVSYDLSNARADKIAASPDLFNNLGINAGLKTHF
jgi:hypothetical protein